MATENKKKATDTMPKSLEWAAPKEGKLAIKQLLTDCAEAVPRLVGKLNKENDGSCVQASFALDGIVMMALGHSRRSPLRNKLCTVIAEAYPKAVDDTARCILLKLMQQLADNKFLPILSGCIQKGKEPLFSTALMVARAINTPEAVGMLYEAYANVPQKCVSKIVAAALDCSYISKGLESIGKLALLEEKDRILKNMLVTMLAARGHVYVRQELMKMLKSQLSTQISQARRSIFELLAPPENYTDLDEYEEDECDCGCHHHEDNGDKQACPDNFFPDIDEEDEGEDDMYDIPEEEPEFDLNTEEGRKLQKEYLAAQERRREMKPKFHKIINIPKEIPEFKDMVKELKYPTSKVHTPFEDAESMEDIHEVIINKLLEDYFKMDPQPSSLYCYYAALDTDEKGFNFLLENLFNKDLLIRSTVCRMLTKIRSDDVSFTEKLLTLVSQITDLQTLAMYLEMLGRRGHAVSRPLLNSMLNRWEPQVRAAAKAAVKMLNLN